MTDTEAETTGSPCPICKKPALKAVRPFCSKRCADADLGKWFTGAYAVPGEPVDPDALPPQERPEERKD